MCETPFPILYEDNHLLVISKPANLPTMGVAEGIPSVLTLAKDYIRRKYHKPGNVYLGIVSRLDAPVTGALVVARTSKAASRLTEQMKKRVVDKKYWALVEEVPEPPVGQCSGWVRKDERNRRMHMTNRQAAGAKEAKLEYATIWQGRPGAVLEVRLETGRKHQIRLQLSALGYPVVGDRKYGSRVPFREGIALHARSIRLIHPVLKTELMLTAPLPKSWRQAGIRHLS